MYYWHWLGGHDRWYDWSLVATTSRTINHDCSYLSSSPIVRNRTLARTTTICERLQMEIIYHRLVVQPVGTACDWSNYWSCDCLTPKSRTTGGATTHEWWCDHTRLVVRPCKTCLRLVIADRSQRVLNMTVDWFCSYDHVRSSTTTTISGMFSLRFDSNS